MYSTARRMASPDKTFDSMHKTENKPARITNTSFVVGVDKETGKTMSSYRSMCKELDRKLHGEFQDDLYVASTGNGGFHQTSMKSRYISIGFPAACKNSLAGKLFDFLCITQDYYFYEFLCYHYFIICIA